MLHLLPKSKAAQLRTEEERQRMAEGMNIAEQVDTLREVLASETVALETYRVQRLESIQEEIGELEQKKEAILSEIRGLQRQVLQQLKDSLNGSFN